MKTTQICFRVTADADPDYAKKLSEKLNLPIEPIPAAGQEESPDEPSRETSGRKSRKNKQRKLRRQEETLQEETLQEKMVQEEMLQTETIPEDKLQGKASAEPLVLRLDAKGLALMQGDLVMQGDFTDMIRRTRPANLSSEILLKAARLKNAGPQPWALDATAGMGEDSLLLAAGGYQVLLYEYDPIICALLEDAIKRAAQVPELAAIAGRMHVHEGDSIAAMKVIGSADYQGIVPDLIMLDPMFPERSKSALVKKKFQLLQQLESPCSAEADLLEAAMTARPKKIVIKRPAKGPYLAGKKPEYSLAGKAIRYDCIVIHPGSVESKEERK